MRVLFFNPEQYVDFQDEPSNIQLRLPILNCGAVTGHRDHMYQRTLRTEGRHAMDLGALKAVADFRPDVVVYSATWEHENLSPWVLKAIRDGAPGRPGIPVVSMLWDSWIEPTTAEAELLANSSVLVVGDSLRTYLRCRLTAGDLTPVPKVAFFGGQVFTDLIHPIPDQPILFDVTLLGSNEGRRAQLVERLAVELPRRGIRFNKAGGLVDSHKGGFALTDQWVSWTEYVRIINGSRLCLNSATDPTRMQIKGKIFDYMACGVACLTDANAETRQFIPDGAIATFENEEDCIAQILRLLNDEDERGRIARAGHQWLTALFDYRRFWSDILASAVGDVRAPTLEVLETLYRTACEERGVLLRSVLENANLVASRTILPAFPRTGTDRETRISAMWLGRQGPFHCLALEEGWFLATPLMPVDILKVQGGFFLAVRGQPAVPIAPGWTRVNSADVLLAHGEPELRNGIDLYPTGNSK